VSFPRKKLTPRRRLAAQARKYSTGIGDSRATAMTFHGRSKGKVALGAGNGSKFYSPAESLARGIADALDPAKAPGKVKTFTAEEREALAAKYRSKP
jgi:hypothetical protein